MEASIIERQATRITVDLPRDPTAPSSARHALDSLAPDLEYERAQAAKLLLSELVTNSVKYGGEGPVRVEIERWDGGLRVEVIDPGPGFVPEPRERCLEDVGGWGLVLVEQLSSRWGSFSGSCHVWFELEIG